MAHTFITLTEDLCVDKLKAVWFSPKAITNVRHAIRNRYVDQRVLLLNTFSLLCNSCHLMTCVTRKLMLLWRINEIKIDIISHSSAQYSPSRNVEKFLILFCERFIVNRKQILREVVIFRIRLPLGILGRSISFHLVLYRGSRRHCASFCRRVRVLGGGSRENFTRMEIERGFLSIDRLIISRS